jgi:hypothetical protein
MNNPIQGQSTEYNDNRISLYVGQRGTCALTKEKLRISDVEVHHKVPRSSRNIKPDKEKSTEKIDGAVVLIMALDRIN